MSMPKNEIEFEDQESEEDIDVSISKQSQRVHSKKSDTSIFELYHWYKTNRLNLTPDFQRMQVWDNKKSSRLIESVLLEVPIPLIYLNQENNGDYSVIDGQQRLTAFFDFIDSKFKLTGLTILSDLNGKTFRDLSDELQKKIEDTTIPIITISNDSDPNVKFDIFERLNTGSVQLNAQELRNSIYRGPYNDLIKKLAVYPDFLYLLGLEKPHFRMQDVELVLRFFAFFHQTYLNYATPTKQFLNKEMEEHKILIENEIQELTDVFKKSVDLTKTVFGENAFHRFVAGTSRDPNGHYEDKMNKGLFDIIMYGFTRYQKNEIVPYSDIIKESMISMMVNDTEFINSISGSGTDKKEKVSLRFRKWLDILDSINVNRNEPRTFSWADKKQLYDSNPVCAICGNKIQTIDDAEIDHIEPYSRGGNTTLMNARLVHRYCNRSRSLRENNVQLNTMPNKLMKKTFSNGKAHKGKKTSQQEFRIPILKALIKLRGRGTMKDVLKIVKEEMKDKLKPIDFEFLPSGKSIRWENTARWERFNMVEDGLLSSNSPKGIWEITEKGKKYFSENENMPH